MDRPRRSARNSNKSLAQLQERLKAIEGDDDQLFQDLDADDDSFDEKGLSDTGEDVVDSDFDDAEKQHDPDDDGQTDKLLRREELKSKKKSTAYVDPAIKKKKASTKRVTIKLPDADKRKTAEPGRSSLRKSTKVASARAAEKREKRREREQQRRQRRLLKEKDMEEEEPLTQQQLLEEAKETEKLNKESLKELLRLEEEKKRVPKKKNRDVGPKMTWKSRQGASTISFTEGVEPGSILFEHLQK